MTFWRGVTAAAYLVAQVMAYAQMAGLHTVTGLPAALPTLVIYAAAGSSRSLSLGSEATKALMARVRPAGSGGHGLQGWPA